MPVLEHDGVSTHYELDGAGAPALVFVHGWCCDTRYFAPQFDHFKSDHRVLSIDLRGHGQSGPGVISIEHFADDVAAVAQAAGVERPIIVGHSMGGLIALELASRHADLATALVLVDPAPVAITPELEGALGGLLDGLRSPASADVRRGFLEEAPFFFQPTDEQATRAWIIDVMCAVPDDVALAGMEGITAWAGRHEGDSWDLPILIINATPGVNTVDILRERLPHAEIEQTADVGHFNQLFAPDQVNALIARFAAKVAAPA